jgi:hypothetical protein
MSELEKKISDVENSIEKLKNNEFNFHFITIDSKGVPNDYVENIYDHVKTLTEMGHNANILYEKEDYVDASEWLGEEYKDLKKLVIEGSDLKVSMHDFIVVPEAFPNIMKQLKNLPSKKIVLCQNYDYILDTLPFTSRWVDYGFVEAIVTSNWLGEITSTLFPNESLNIIPFGIDTKLFNKPNKKKDCKIAIYTNDSGLSARIIKAFYLKYPMYKWLTFVDCKSLTPQKLSEELKSCCLSVWIDPNTTNSTFPLKSIECDTPVIGKIPEIIPDWMKNVNEENGSFTIEDNGLWINSTIAIPDIIAQYMKNWFEDNKYEVLNEKMEELRGKYTKDKQKEAIQTVYKSLIEKRLSELNNVLNNLKELQSKNLVSDEEK